MRKLTLHLDTLRQVSTWRKQHKYLAVKLLLTGAIFSSTAIQTTYAASNSLSITEKTNCEQLLTGHFGLSSSYYIELSKLTSENDLQGNAAKKAMATENMAMYFIDEHSLPKTKTPDMTTLAKLMPLDTSLWHIMPETNHTPAHLLRVTPSANTPFKHDSSTVRYLKTDSLIPSLTARKEKMGRNMPMSLLEALLASQPTLSRGCEVSLPHNSQSVQLIHIDTANMPEDNLVKMQRYLTQLLSINMTRDELKNQHYWVGSYVVVPEVTSMLVFLPVMKMQN